MSELIHIDGAEGEGGGQVLRTSLGLSMHTGRAFRIARIRAKREKPGLMRQHLTAVLAAQLVCGADVSGATIGSRELTFRPGAVEPGTYRFATGSAGSTTLVLQTLLPAMLVGPVATFELHFEGGTHNPFAPPFDFLERCFAPVVRTSGAQLDLTLERHGFYPAGGGRFSARVTRTPAPNPIRLDTRGIAVGREAIAKVSALPGDIAVRELASLRAAVDLTEQDCRIVQLPADQGPGNVLSLAIAYEHVTEIATAWGKRGLTAEAVAQEVADDARRYLSHDAPVGEHLADQLLIPLALAGGSFVTGRPSLHTTTNLEVIRRFLDRPLALEPIDERHWRASGEC